MRSYKTRWFARYARREKISDSSLADAAGRAERGPIDADLGGGVIKQRVARKGQGRSGGYRLLLAFRKGQQTVFLYGFSKSERENIGAKELATLKELAAAWLSADAAKIAEAIESGVLFEVRDEN